MPGWLTAAANALKRHTEEPPQRYEIRCACGEMLAGMRGAASQTTVCQNCGATWFVLPASVYPLPRAPRQKVARVAVPAAPKSRPRGPRPGASDTPGAPAPAVERPAGSAGRRRARPSADQEQILPGAEETDRPAARRPRRKLLTPVRFAFLGTAAIVVATIWWLVHAQRLEQARAVLAEAPRLGEVSLEEGDLTEAARQFDRARAALDTLGRNDFQARAWRQLARETNAASSLFTSSLHELLHDAAAAAADPSRPLLVESFRGQWVVVDAVVARADDASNRVHFNVDLPLLDAEARAQIVGDLPAFAQVLGSSGEQRRIIFAAQLDECRIEPERENTWLIVLRPSTAFLWSNGTTYRQLGMPADDATLKTLDDQSQILGIAP